MLFVFVSRPSATPVLPEGVSATEYDQAAEEYEKLFHRRARESDIFMMLAETAMRQERIETAVECLSKIPAAYPRHGAGARRQQAQLLLKLNRIADAETCLRELLQREDFARSPDSETIQAGLQMMVFILAIELRFEERQDVLRRIRSIGPLDVALAKQYHFPSLVNWKTPQQHTRLQEFLSEDPGNAQLLVAHARHLVGAGKTDMARRLLDAIREHSSDDPMTLAVLLECCYEQNQWSDIVQILATTRPFSEGEPWLLSQMRAEAAAHAKDWEQAEEYFRHVLKLDPANPACLMGLAKVLAGQNRTDERLAVQDRVLKLAELRIVVQESDPRETGALQAIAEAAESLNMEDAARDFARLAKGNGDRKAGGTSRGAR